LISLFNRSRGFVDQIFFQCSNGKTLKAKTSGLAVFINSVTFGN
jgi:hypothetical protein